MTWRWQDMPEREDSYRPALRRTSKRSGGSPVRPLPESRDLRLRIVAILDMHGDQAPREIGLRLSRSHRPVYRAVRFLVEADVVEATGRTCALRYRLKNGWRVALERALPPKHAFVSAGELIPDSQNEKL